MNFDKSTIGETLIVVGLLGFFGGSLGYVTESLSATEAAIIDVLALLVLGIGLGVAQSQASVPSSPEPTDQQRTGSLTNFGAGMGLALGAGIGLVIGILVGSDLALTAGYGVAGGLVMGAVVGQFAERAPEHEDPGLRVLSVALLVGIAFGGLLGVLGAWSFDESLLAGLEVGSAAGGLHAVVLANLIIGSNRRLRGTGTDQDRTGPSRPAR